MRKKGIMYSELYGSNDRESLEMIKKAGFDSIMLGWYPDEKIKELCSICRSIGLEPEILHAPFSHINDMWLEGDGGETVLEVLIDNLQIAAKNGIPYVVVHLSSGDNAPHLNDIGIERFGRLVEAAERNGVTVAFENQRKLANIAFMMEKYKDNGAVGFCWDNGHEACFAGGREYMPLFGSKLVCTHIHDNFAQKDGDLHLIPFEGNYDFNRYAEHIKKSGYKGTLLLETAPSRSDDGELSPSEFLQKAYNAVSVIADLCRAE